MVLIRLLNTILLLLLPWCVAPAQTSEGEPERAERISLNYCYDDPLTDGPITNDLISLKAPYGHLSYHWNSGSTQNTSSFLLLTSFNAKCEATSADGTSHTYYAHVCVNENPPSTQNVIYGTVCQGEPFTNQYFYIERNNRVGTFTYTTTIIDANSCQDMGDLVLQLTVNPTNLDIQPYYDTICCGDDYHLGGFDIGCQDSVGVFTFTDYQTNIYGCDSIREMNLCVVRTPDIDIYVEMPVLCEGEDATIYAISENATIIPNGISIPPQIGIGDILCEDDTIVRAKHWPVINKIAKGIIFYVDSTGQHGWAVSLINQGYGVKWSTERVNIPGLGNVDEYADAINDLNGKQHTQAIRDFSSSGFYPAAFIPRFVDGWYLPSIGQLVILYGCLPEINQSIDKAGGVKFPMDDIWWLWSSSPNSTRNAWYLNSTGLTDTADKYYTNDNCRVRSIIDF